MKLVQNHQERKRLCGFLIRAPTFVWYAVKPNSPPLTERYFLTEYSMASVLKKYFVYFKNIFSQLVVPEPVFKGVYLRKDRFTKNTNFI